MNTTRHTDAVEVILKDQRRKRWSLAEKAQLVRRTYELGMSVSLVARQEGVAASLLFQWRSFERQGALTAVSAGEAVVPRPLSWLQLVQKLPSFSECWVKRR